MMEYVFSSGGGRQSIAALVLSAWGVLPYRRHVFANTGEKSESAETLAYVREVAMPYAARNGVQFVEVGKGEDLLDYMYRTEKSVPIPVRLNKSEMPAHRACTNDFKIQVIDRWIGDQKWSEVCVGLGITTDELQRAKKLPWVKTHGFVKHTVYPLLFLRLSLHDCVSIIADAGLPIPPKSACDFCPFNSMARWVDLRVNKPERFERAANLESHLSAKKGEPVFMHRSMKPLREAIPAQPSLAFDDDDNCESGYCMV